MVVTRASFPAALNAPHTKPCTAGDSQLELVERPEVHPRVWKNHLDVRARDILEELHVNQVIPDVRCQKTAHPAHGPGRCAPGHLPLAHDLRDPLLLRLELEQDEQPPEDRHVDFLFTEETADGSALIFPSGGATVVHEQLLEGVEVDVEVEPVVGLPRQDQLDLLRVDACVIGLSKQAVDAFHHPLLQDFPLFRRICPRHQQVAVRAERLIVLFKREKPRAVLLLAPIVEVAEKASGVCRLPERPGIGLRQPID